MKLRTREQHSARMACVRSKDTEPELAVRRLAHRLGYRYRLHGAGLPGRPDLVFPAKRKVIFATFSACPKVPRHARDGELRQGSRACTFLDAGVGLGVVSVELGVGVQDGIEEDMMGSRRVQTIGELLAQTRQSAGLTVRALAPMVHKSNGKAISPSYITDIEKGRGIPTDFVTREIAAALGADAEVWLAIVKRARVPGRSIR